ncbi:carbohydrate kinase [Caloramator sp. E03]|uniref:FGGY-family carbohydrate kinase n=1 Tax=Caloramator sp. E03 TaxID=2576307 RepID=UPI00111092A6|nr:FGGY-family carbohydrate kinase [Caloramator sp. E03]QCX34100.1 carbohydrate kinase [Caloramator sp. E03]
MNCVITIDVGTSSLKSTVYTLSGKSLYGSASEYQPVFLKNNYAEQSPETWKNALIQTLNDISKYVSNNSIDIIAISVTSQRASIIPVDKHGNYLHNAIMWQDKRTTQECKKISKFIDINTIYRKTGLRIDPYFSAPKMLWLKENCSEIYNKSYKILGVQDFIIYLLTNKFITDWTQASRTMLMDINNFKWDRDILDILEINEEILPELCPPASIAGKLTDQIANTVGLKGGIPVIIAGGDQQCAAVALNILQEGYAEANTGTGSFVIAYSDKPVFDIKNRTLCSAAAIPGKWVVEAGILTTGTIYRWLKEQFYPDSIDGENKYELLNKEASISTTGANGVIMIPHFQGSAAPYWNPDAKGMFFNLTLGTKRSDIARSVLEGIALEIAENVFLIEENIGNINTISVAGGMTRFDLFNQIQADVFNKPVIKYENSEASSLGALISTSVTLGYYENYKIAFKNIINDNPTLYDPCDKNAEIYKIIINRKNKLYNALNENDIYSLFKYGI